ncbi:MAG: carbamoyltransferase HypF [Bacteroidota bacterium]
MQRALRLRMVLHGAVQGVGFRPFVYRLAHSLQLQGWVSNSAQGVFIEVEGSKNVLDSFLLRVQKEAPPRSFIQSLEYSFLESRNFKGFAIRESDESGKASAHVLPDIATCPDCLSEVFDRTNRRYLYPFTNCTNCGPRFSIIRSLPYDRPNTSMTQFTMCPECQREYDDPNDRRFHAQPNACPRCGPHLELWDATGLVVRRAHDALLGAAKALRGGMVVAVKGLGGFHLMADARNAAAISRLRTRKYREEKPLALLFPSEESVRVECDVSELEGRLLHSPESPIVLLQRAKATPSGIAAEIAPNNPYLGAMLPYTPLHHILLRELGFPVVATSGNTSDEPICIDERDALERLRGIADLFLVHDRPIVRHVDDSIARVMLGREQILRRARGYAPLSLRVDRSSECCMIAVGAHLKNTVAMSSGRNIFVSQHIGDLETARALQVFQNVIQDFRQLYDETPGRVIRDLHPDYLSGKLAESFGAPVVSIQHHYAHVTSCMAENEIVGNVLGVSWDGTGYGTDGTVWGGEFLRTTETGYTRVATLRPFKLPGGEKAIKEPRRSAIGILYELYGQDVFRRKELFALAALSEREISTMRTMLVREVNSPWTTSVGRLFDAVSSLLDIQQRSTYEGQAAMELEFAIQDHVTNASYPFTVDGSTALAVIDWAPMILAILEDSRKKIPAGIISARFHNTLSEIVLDRAKSIALPQIVLTGGCFQNRHLTERVVRTLEGAGFRPFWHQRIPPNDGGISLGQLYAYLRSRPTGPTKPDIESVINHEEDAHVSGNSR